MFITSDRPSARHEVREEVKLMAIFRRRIRRVRAVGDRGLDRELVLEALRQQRSVRRSVDEQLYRLRGLR